MAVFHCRYCEGEFASLDAYDDHLLPRVKEFVCVGQRDGKPYLDPDLVVLRARMAEVRKGRADEHVDLGGEG